MKEIEIDRELLNPHFDGYKLNLDPLPIYDVKLAKDVDSPKLSHDTYSYHHVKLFGNHNKLYRDPWCEETAWFVNCNWEILKVHLDLQCTPFLKDPISYYTIPNCEKFACTKNRYPVSLSFPDENFLVISNGTGNLIILNTLDRKNNHVKYEECYNGSPLGQNIEFQVIHSESYKSEGKHCLEILCAFINNKDENTISTKSLTCLEWLTFILGPEMQFDILRRRTLQTTGIPDFAAIVGNGTKMVVCNENIVKFSYDSMEPVVSETKNITCCAPLYTWTQNGRKVKVVIRVEEGITAADIKCNLCCDSIELKIGACDDFLINGKLANRIVLECCTWSIADSMIVIYLEKEDDATWQEIIVGDAGGQLTCGEDNEDKEDFTLEGSVEDGKVYNSQELEECDYSNTSPIIYWFDGCSHANEQQVNLTSSQWLFSNASSLSNVPLICIRHDVDGLVFRLQNENHNPKLEWKHVATFNALGYVQASKQQKKYTVCSPDFSYVAIVEVSRHIFIYRQPSMSSVKSRKTSLNLMVALHHMVTLETNDTIEGAFATNSHLLILTQKRLQAIRIN